MKLSCRKIFEVSIVDIWDVVTGHFTIVDDYGVELETNASATIYTRYIWEMLKKYPKTKLSVKHHLSYGNPNNRLRPDTHERLLNLCMWDTIDQYGITEYADRLELQKELVDISNYIYNNLSELLAEYVTSIDLMDFINVAQHPKVKEVRDNMEISPVGIQTAYKDVGQLLRNDPTLTHNRLAKAITMGMVKESQAMQCVVARGYLTDIDSSIFPKPITNGYLHGLETPYDILIESRSAAKALFFQLDHLSDSEYFARKLQIVSMYVERLHIGDCGTTEYLDWYIRPKEEEHGQVTYKGDFYNMIGKYYLNEETGELAAITKEDTHLIGTTVKLRSVEHCNHKDKHGVCSICFGKLSDNVNLDGNLGHQCAANVNRNITQNILGTKHIDGSSSGSQLVLDKVASVYFGVHRDKLSYVFKPSTLKLQDISINISNTEAYGMSDIISSSNVDNINPSRVGKLSAVGITYKDKSSTRTVPIDVMHHNRRIEFTSAFIHYVKEHGYTIDSNNNYVIDLSSWNVKEPIMCIPNTEYNYSDLADEVKKLIESNIKQIRELHNPTVVLSKMFELLNSKLSINLALVEVIVYAFTCAGEDIQTGEFNYDMARGHDKPEMGINTKIINGRSLSNLYGFEQQIVGITNPNSFNAENRPDSVFDALLCPAETLEDRKNRGLPI